MVCHHGIFEPGVQPMLLPLNKKYITRSFGPFIYFLPLTLGPQPPKGYFLFTKSLSHIVVKITVKRFSTKYAATSDNISVITTVNTIPAPLYITDDILNKTLSTEPKIQRCIRIIP